MMGKSSFSGPTHAPTNHLIQISKAFPNWISALFWILPHPSYGMPMTCGIIWGIKLPSPFFFFDILMAEVLSFITFNHYSVCGAPKHRPGQILAANLKTQTVNSTCALKLPFENHCLIKPKCLNSVKHRWCWVRDLLGHFIARLYNFQSHEIHWAAQDLAPLLQQLPCTKLICQHLISTCL